MFELIKRVISLKIRKRRRYRLRKGAYVVLSSSPGRYQIDDIGIGGLSFHFIDNGFKPKNASQEIKIAAESQSNAIHLAGKIVADSEIGELIFQRQKIVRRSICFDRMPHQTRKELEYFIKNNVDANL